MYGGVCNRYFMRELLEVETQNKRSKMGDCLDRSVGGLIFWWCLMGLQDSKTPIFDLINLFLSPKKR